MGPCRAERKKCEKEYLRARVVQIGSKLSSNQHLISQNSARNIHNHVYYSLLKLQNGCVYKVNILHAEQ